MLTSASQRFHLLLREETDRLKDNEGSEINPTKKRKTGNKFFRDNCDYVYSLCSLDDVLYQLDCSEQAASEWKDKKWKEDQYMIIKMDEQRKESLETLPSQIAFDLRGYIGAFSEDSMVLEEKRLEELKNVLKGWYSVKMSGGDEQDRLYHFLYDYALTQFIDEGVEDRKDDLIKQRVYKEMKAFKEVLAISGDILGSIYYAYLSGE